MANQSAKLPQGNQQSPLCKVFDFFNQNNILFCVLGQSSGYPETYSGDVDIAVSDETFRTMDQIIGDLCCQTGLRLVQVLRHEQTACAYVVCWYTPVGTPDFLMLDICSDYYRHGQRLLGADELLNGRKSSGDGSYCVATPATEFIYYLLKKLGKQELDSTHIAHLSQVFLRDPDGAARNIGRFFTMKQQKELTAAAETNRWETIQANLAYFKPHDCFTRQENSVQALLRKVKRVLCPTGLFVIVLGPDGSGKSTVIDQVMSTLSGAFRRTQYFHLRPRLGVSSMQNTPPVTNPHAQPPRSLMLSVLKVFYFWLDYTLGYWLKLYWLMVRSTLVVFDRYYYDLMIDPRRFRYQGPRWLVQAVGSCIPKADLVILLDAPTEVLQARKQEVSPDETERQRQAFLDLVKTVPNSHVVNAALPLHELMVCVNDIVLAAMESRMKYRYGKP